MSSYAVKNGEDVIPQTDAASAPRTLVLALGNPLRGDDGAGIAVLEQLRRVKRRSRDFTLLDGGTRGLEIMSVIQGYEHVIVVDAGDIGRAPGQWACFSLEDIVEQLADTGLRGTLHSIGLAEALTLGATLDTLPPEIVIYVIQPLHVGWRPGLSQPVQKAVPAVHESIVQRLYEVA